MREILFRGKEANDNWVYGFFVEFDGSYNSDGEPYQYPQIVLRNGESCFVEPKTIGQFTGLLDKNGVKIFEGDILTLDFEGENNASEVKYFDNAFWLERKDGTRHWPKSEFCTVIDNIHDNPTLLKAEV